MVLSRNVQLLFLDGWYYWLCDFPSMMQLLAISLIVKSIPSQLLIDDKPSSIYHSIKISLLVASL